MTNIEVHIHDNIMRGGARLLGNRIIVEYLDDHDMIDTSTACVGRVLSGAWNGSVIYFRKSNDVIELSTEYSRYERYYIITPDDMLGFYTKFEDKRRRPDE